jgi:DUF1365 family protein
VNSCIYRGTLGHCRHAPAFNSFHYDVFMLYLDLDELQTLFKPYWLWSTERINFAWFRRADYLGCSQKSLSQCVRDLVADRIGSQPMGPIRLLTNLRYLFYKSNPVSFFYCFETDGKTLHSIVAEVTNTPWGERYYYVLGEEQRNPLDEASESYCFKTAKQFTVSPFMPLDMDYWFRFTLPAKQLRVEMQNHRQGKKVFDVELCLQAQPINSINLAKQLLRIPLMTAKVTAAIYWQAFKVWCKGVPFLGHGGEKH